MYVTATSATDTFGHALHSLTKEEASARNVSLPPQLSRYLALHVLGASTPLLERQAAYDVA